MLIKRWELRGRAWSEKVKSQQAYLSASWSSLCCSFSCVSNLIHCLTINPRAMGWNLQNHDPKELTPSLSSLVEIVVVWMRNVPQRLMYLNTWSPVCGAFWRGCRKFGRSHLSGGSTLLQSGFVECFEPQPSSSSPYWLCIWGWRCDLSALSSSPVTRPAACYCASATTIDSHPSATAIQNKPFLPWVVLALLFYHTNRKVTTTETESWLPSA